MARASPLRFALAWTVAVKPATHILYCNAPLGQLQYHNHQDDDHQHPDNDANDASVHFASIEFPWSNTSGPVVHEPNLAEIAEPRGYSPQVR